jgi:glycosyltransferase involved in cell wall biosynthesis
MISVLMPVHNARPWLAQAIDSILAQTFRDFELLIIDDGSMDGSGEVLERLAQRDERIHLRSRPRTGYIAALNEMLEQARGEFIARMDADDIAHPGRFRQQLEFLLSNPGVVCLGTAFEIIDERGTRLTRLAPPEDDPEIQRLLLRGHTALCHPSVMMRTSALRHIGGYDPQLTSIDDLDLFLRLGEIGLLANLQRSLLRYRIHSSSVSAVAGQQQRELARDVCRRAWQRRAIPEDQRCFEAGDEWRPGQQRASRFRFALRYGWWAFKSGERKAALRYGARAAALMPWRRDGWVLVASAALKPLPWPELTQRPVHIAAGTLARPGSAPIVPARPRPRIAILMPVYNAQQFLKDSIENMLEQSFTEFEFIIIDDGSTDDSPLLLRHYAAQDRRIRIFGRERGGYVSALNYGLQFARARYIARMDADDLCEPTRLELQFDRLERDLDLVALGSCAWAIDPQGRRLGHFDVPLSHQEIEAAHLRGESSIHHPSVMIRRAALNAVGRYRPGFAPAEDFDLWLRLGEVGQLGNLPERLLSKRLTTSGVVGSTLWLQESVVTWALQDTWKRRNLGGQAPRIARGIRTQADLFRQWGWLALRHQNLSTARLYAARSILREPLHEHSWRLAYCALRGR